MAKFIRNSDGTTTVKWSDGTTSKFREVKPGLHAQIPNPASKKGAKNNGTKS